MKVTITITDLKEEGQVGIKVEFDPPVDNDTVTNHTTASRLAVRLMKHMETMATEQ